MNHLGGKCCSKAVDYSVRGPRGDGWTPVSRRVLSQTKPQENLQKPGRYSTQVFAVGSQLDYSEQREMPRKQVSEKKQRQQTMAAETRGAVL